VRLSELIDWARLEAHFAPHYSEVGRPGVPITLPPRTHRFIRQALDVLQQMQTYHQAKSCANSPGERKMRRYHHIGIPTTESKPGKT
jgi:hypothetical protein